MKTTKAKFLAVLLVTSLAAAGVLAAVAMAWPQSQPRSLQQPQQPQRQQAQVPQPEEPLVGGSSQGTLYFPE